MGLSIVTPASLDEWTPFRLAISAAFGTPAEPMTEQRARLSPAIAPLDFRVGIVDGDEVLGGCQSSVFDLSMPGGGAVAAAGLSAVGIDPTKTGRGGLRLMMEEHLRRTKSQGLAASTLLASESGLYAKFGYGHATSIAAYQIDSNQSDFDALLDDDGSLELISDVGEVANVFASTYAAAAGVQAGTTSRSPEWWEVVLGKEAGWMGGGKQLGVFHRTEAGDVDGYMLYAMGGQSDWVTAEVVQIKELIAVNLTAELRLFQFATRIPLSRSVRWGQAPLDNRVRHHLSDPRQLRQVTTNDLLWLRPIDVPALLEARTYLHNGSITIGIDDSLFEDQRGPWTLTVSDGIGRVTRADRDADLTVTPSQLGSVLLGDTRVIELVAAGRLEGNDSSIRDLDRLMLTERRPFTLSKF